MSSTFRGSTRGLNEHLKTEYINKPEVLSGTDNEGPTTIVTGLGLGTQFKSIDTEIPQINQPTGLKKMTDKTESNEQKPENPNENSRFTPK